MATVDVNDTAVIDLTVSEVDSDDCPDSESDHSLSLLTEVHTSAPSGEIVIEPDDNDSGDCPAKSTSIPTPANVIDVR